VLGHTVDFARDPFGFVRRSVEATGDAFRMRLLGDDAYVFAHPDYVEPVLADRGSFGKLDDFRVAFGEALIAVEGEQWRRQRRAMEDVFSPSRLRTHTETMVDVAESRVDDWSPGQSVRVDQQMRALALRNLFEVVLDRSLSGDEAERLAATAHSLNLWFKPTSWALPEWVPTPARRRFERGSAALHERARTLLNDTADDPRGDGLLAALAAHRDNPDSEIGGSAVLDQVVGMLFAGHETTALSLTYALHQLASHPEVADRFHAELDDVTDGPITAADLDELDYLERVIDETLRRYPAVHTVPRVTTEPVEVGQYRLPAGVPALVSVWSLHRDSRFYDDPLTFDPGRWERSSPRERGYAFIPFGAGPRVCIGRHFARLEMKATLAVIGRRYRLETDDELDVTPQMTTQPDDPVTVRLEERS
jgi:cytochrome P450